MPANDMHASDMQIYCMHAHALVHAYKCFACMHAIDFSCMQMDLHACMQLHVHACYMHVASMPSLEGTNSQFHKA
jgi:hypothetical protein